MRLSAPKRHVASLPTYSMGGSQLPSVAAKLNNEGSDIGWSAMEVGYCFLQPMAGK